MAMKNIVDRTQNRLKTPPHTNPLVFETSESEGIPETLEVCIPKCGAAECDAHTLKMFGLRDGSARYLLQAQSLHLLLTLIAEPVCNLMPDHSFHFGP